MGETHMEAFDLGWDGMDSIERLVLEPEECAKIETALRDPVWVYKYKHKKEGWVLSIASYGEPFSNKLSLGGFRIATENRVNSYNYNNDREAIDLAIGMEKKVFWSRLLRISGPLGAHNLDRIVGGKCVLLPTDDARIGKPKDFALLDFAVSCLRDFESSSGISLTTGQDLGHGVMSDRKTSSLAYLNERFPGCITSDTSIPTAEGNFYLLKGVLDTMEISLDKAKVGLIGCGKIGSHILRRLKENGAEVYALDFSPLVLKRLTNEKVPCWALEKKGDFLKLPLDALVVNADGGTLDESTIEAIGQSSTLRVVCGCENLAMPDPRGEAILLSKKKLFAPTELCGMMGYLTAVEDYLAYSHGTDMDLGGVIEGASGMESAAIKATQYVKEKDFAVSFGEAMQKVHE